MLEENLPYVIKSIEEVPQAEIIIVDDASTDSSIEFLKSTYPDIKIIENASNIGFGASVNTGLRKTNSQLVLLLNSDIKPDRYYISTSLKYFDDPLTFGVMGAIKDEFNKEILEGIKWPKASVTGLKYKDLRMPEIEKCNDKIFTFYLCGGNAIVDRTKMLELHGFLDLYYPFYLEDVDLSLRAWLSGWRLYFNPEAHCYHKHSATINKYYSKDFVNIISKRNRLILSYLYLSGYKEYFFRITTYIKSQYYKILYAFKLSHIYQGYREYYRILGKLSTYRPPMDKTMELNQVIAEIRSNIMEKSN